MLPLHRGGEGQPPCLADVSSARRFPLGLPRLGAASAVDPCGGGRAAVAADPGQSTGAVAARTARPRVHADLRREGVRVGRKRVERLMRAAELSGSHGRRKGKTTIRVQGVRVADDLVDRDFTATVPDQLWMSDIKDDPDLGGQALPRLGARLLLTARRRLVDARPHACRARRRGVGDGAQPPPAAGRTDRPFRSGLAVRLAGVRPALPAGRDRPVDGLEGRLLTTTPSARASTPRSRRTCSAGARSRRRQEARTAVFDYIEAFYNRERLHSTLGYASGVSPERSHLP